jgi:hypothetical protein
LETEASGFFQRATTDANTFYLGVLGSYNTAIAAKPVNQVQVLQISTQLQQSEKDLAALSTSDPTAAINGFGSSHAALVKVVSAKTTEEKKKFLAELIAQVKSFVAEVKSPSKGSSSPSNPKS